MAQNEQRPAAEAPRLTRRLSPLAIWALSFGCSVGWGAFVMPGTTFLPIAGPLGTALGIAAGALVMLLIGVNYHYLMSRYGDAGGTFTYTKKVFGYDHGFLAAWFLGLVYLAIIWANATALPLICRSLFGDVFRFGFHYVIAGYDVWCGEILLSLAVVLLFGFLCTRGRASSAVQTAMALLLAAGVAVVFLAAFLRPEADPAALQPLFSPAHRPAVGTLFIVFLAPWAFAGFESVSQSVEEFKPSPSRSLPILIASLAASAAAYIALALLAASARPAGFAGWDGYVAALDGLSGIEALPTFFGANAALGTAGVVILGLAAAAAIITGLVGNTTAASRLLYAMARDELLPAPLAKLNKWGVPRLPVLLLMLVSLPIPFFGRAAIGWIVDVNTIGVTVAYAYTSAAAFKETRRQRRPLPCVTGALGMAVSLFFLLYFLVPNFWSLSALSAESYLILLLWSVLGFAVFYFLFRRDRAQRMGRSTMVWVVLLLLTFFASILWIRGTAANATAAAVRELGAGYTAALTERGAAPSAAELAQYTNGLTARFGAVTGTIIRSTYLQFLLVMAALLIIFHIYGTVQRRHQTAVEDKTIAEQSSQAKTTFLSNMSHDIRTPMNAIVGYVTLAKREKDLTPRVQDYLSKIEASSDHLLALINDVLEMSRIESGRMELVPVATDLGRMMEDVRDLFSTQMETKGLTYTVSCEDVTDLRVLCDRSRFDRVLLNLISNAYKFTPEGGSVTVTLRQTGREADRASYRLSVKDTGIGMSPEFAAKVFEAYERERTATVESIQGTGLGTAITKSIVELMGGTIEVSSKQGEGSEFVIHVAFPVDPGCAHAETAGEKEGEKSAFAGMRLLLAEDDDANREVARMLLEEAGFLMDVAADGEEAVEIIAASVPGEYAAVLMDIEMPVKDGYEAARLIRSLRNPALASIPIVALTAKAFSEDIAAARDAQMNGHIAKPLNMRTALETLSDVLL